jgi:tetratricopeptide (TPR) repeat protein
LARALDSAGRAEQAVTPIAEALAIQTDEFGAFHVQVATDLVWQAVVDAHTGQLPKAERDAREALRFFDSYTGAVRADMPNMRTVIGGVLAEVGKLDEADAQITRAAADLRAAPLHGAFLGFALDALGDVARRRRQLARARDLANEALPLLERGLDDQHSATALARVHAGAARWSLGETADGEPIARQGLATLEQQFPDGHPDLAAARLIVGDLLRESGRPLEAHSMIQKALAWREAHFGPADPRTVAARQSLRSTTR